MSTLTVPEVAARLHVQPATVRRFMRAGRIEASKSTGSWLTSEQAVEKFLEAGSNHAQSSARRRRRRAS